MLRSLAAGMQSASMAGLRTLSESSCIYAIDTCGKNSTPRPGEPPRQLKTMPQPARPASLDLLLQDDALELALLHLLMDTTSKDLHITEGCPQKMIHCTNQNPGSSLRNCCKRNRWRWAFGASEALVGSARTSGCEKDSGGKDLGCTQFEEVSPQRGYFGSSQEIQASCSSTSPTEWDLADNHLSAQEDFHLTITHTVRLCVVGITCGTGQKLNHNNSHQLKQGIGRKQLTKL